MQAKQSKHGLGLFLAETVNAGDLIIGAHRITYRASSDPLTASRVRWRVDIRGYLPLSQVRASPLHLRFTLPAALFDELPLSAVSCHGT